MAEVVNENKGGLFKQLFMGPDIVRDSALEERERKVTVLPEPRKEGDRVVKQDIVKDSALETREAKVTVEPGPRKEGERVVKQDIVRDSMLERQLFGKAL